MGFSNGAYAKIKQVEDKGNYTKAKVVISKKMKNTHPQQYVCTFAGLVNFVGKAHQCRPQAGQKIKITNCDVTNGYIDRDGQQKFMDFSNFTIFEYELQDASGFSTNTVQPNWEELSSEDSLPF